LNWLPGLPSCAAGKEAANMSYIDDSLGDGETVVARAHFHWLYSALAWAALIFLGILVIGIVIFLSMMIRKWTTEIGVTTHRFVEKKGLFTMRTNEIALPNIEGVKVHQGVLGRIFGYGTVRVEGTGVDAVTTPTIADPVGFVRAIQTAKEHQPAKY
jgi:uncharacterized membrane protein YdbT with pleckstrin-like domain